MRIFGINTYHFGSTGSIMNQVAQVVRDNGGEAVTCATKWKGLAKASENKLYFGFTLENWLHYFLGKYFGLNGRLSIFGTIVLCFKIARFKPDIIHLNNLLSPRVCLPLLFGFIKRRDIPVVWTLHDCWAFTGHCTHFLYEKCDKWKTLCCDCTLYKSYPSEYSDNSKKNYIFKRDTFTKLSNMTIVTPSLWLASMVKDSFLNKYQIETIHSGINLEIFNPKETNLKDKLNCQNKYVVLGVAFAWDKKKGIDILQRLANELPDNYRVILVGDYAGELCSNVIHISRTDNPIELAEFYSCADVFVNPTREEVLGLVNIEALACGTPVVAFDSGGCSECFDSCSGVLVKCDDYNSLKATVINVCENRPFSKTNCINKAKEFDQEKLFNKYYDLFENIINKK